MANLFEEPGCGCPEAEGESTRLMTLPSRGFEPHERGDGGIIGSCPHTWACTESGLQVKVVLAHRAASVLTDPPQPVALLSPDLSTKRCSFPDVELDEGVVRLDRQLLQ